MITLASRSRAASAAHAAALPAPTTITSGLPKSISLILPVEIHAPGRDVLTGGDNFTARRGGSRRQHAGAKREPDYTAWGALMQRLWRALALGIGAGGRRGRVMHDHAPAVLGMQIDIRGDDRRARTRFPGD